MRSSNTNEGKQSLELIDAQGWYCHARIVPSLTMMSEQTLVIYHYWLFITSAYRQASLVALTSKTFS